LDLEICIPVNFDHLDLFFMMNPSLDDHEKNESPPDAHSPSIESAMRKSPADTKIPGHDSMVTVRLSEPPSLSVNTDLPTAAMPSRRSIFGPQCTPTSATVVCEKEEAMEVVGHDAEPERDTIAPTMVHDGLESNNESLDKEERPQSQNAMEDSDTEEVDWERLQKTENEQVKDPDDNVRTSPENLGSFTDVDVF
jgi:hypothetical protein